MVGCGPKTPKAAMQSLLWALANDKVDRAEFPDGMGNGGNPRQASKSMTSRVTKKRS